jgi:hypothetical protein
MDQRYDFEERINRIGRKLMVGVVASNSLGIAAGLVALIVMYGPITLLTILVAFTIAIAITAHLVYREMDEAEDEDIPALIREKILYVFFVIIAGHVGIVYLSKLMTH